MKHALMKNLLRRSFALALLLAASAAHTQTVPPEQGAPPEGVACVVSAGNRVAPLRPDGSYAVFGIPGNLGAIRARATCSDGSVGQSAIGFTNPLSPATVELGPISFGQLDPVPVAVALNAPVRQLGSGEDSQLQALAVAADGTQRDVTPRSEGSVYTISNDLLATVTEDGLVHIYPQFAPGSSSRVVAGVTSEGSVSATFMYLLGPRASLTGSVMQPDGLTPVVGAEVSVLRLQPMEQAGTVVTGADGRFSMAGVNAGSFIVSAIHPATGDRALTYARIANEAEVVDVQLRLNGLGRVDVTVLDALDATVAATEVTFTALGAYRDVRTLATDASGVAAFQGVAAGDFTVSVRDPATRLIGTAVARVSAGEVLPVTLKLQPIGEIRGRVFDVGGSALRAGVQVRILSRERGIITQAVTGADGAFAFDTLPIADSPFTLDAFVDGRLRARLPGVVLASANEILNRDIVLDPVGTVSGHVVGGGGTLPDARVVLQSLEGLRLSFETRSDANGRFAFPAVPVGDFELLATAANGQTGRALGRVDSDAQQVNIDVAIADDTLVGVVHQRDGITPVGAGVTVYLAPKSLGARYSYDGVANVLSTQTAADGRFGFIVAATGTYYVQAEDALERGRSELIVVNLNPSQPLQARVVYLAKGTVSGTVRDVNGVAQAGIPVTVRSEGAFTLDRQTQTDGNGHYAMTGVFAGDIVVTARNPATALAGQGSSRLIAEGEAVAINITLAATATISGRVLQRVGGVSPGPVRISLRRNGSQIALREFPTGDAYSFDLVPIGEFELIAEELATGDKGVATTRIAAANDDKQIDIRLVGQGTITVTLRDEGGLPVTGAKVTANTVRPFASNQQLISDGNGQVSFERVFAGDFSISASKQLTLGALGGSASGTLLPNQQLSIDITMSTLVIGGVAGVVYQPDGITPAGAGLVVRMLPEPFQYAFVGTTDAQGRYAFSDVPAGSYSIDVLRFFNPQTCPQRDRVRGRTSGIQVQQQGAVTTADVQLIGAGVVRGRVTNAQGNPVAGIEVRMTNPDPIYGLNVTCVGRTTYDRNTDANGEYLIEDAPPGDFTLTAENSARTLRAEGSGRVRFDGDEAVVDLELVDSAITMPYTLYDANGFRFDLNGIGAIANGTNNVFAGSAPDNAGMRLEIIRDGIAVPFSNGNGSVGRLVKNGQQVDVDDSVPAGLIVTRQVYVPRAGYFSRYLEILENPGATAITVDVRVKSHHRNSNSNPRVVDTSDGDQILTVTAGAQRDRWAIVDDQQDADPFATGSIPATGHLFDGPDAPTQVAAATYDLIGQTGRLSYRWDGITVAPGQRVILMHFTLNQLNRFAGREAAMRLSALPPEAIDDLTTDERQAIVNFVVPEVSALPALPNLDAGRLDGRVFSGDGVTPIAAADVRFKSKHPLFGRVRNRTTNSDGYFEFRSTLDGSAANYVIPVHGFDLSASYPQTGAASALTPGDFDEGSTSETQDLIFVGQGDVRGLVKRHNDALVASATVNLCRLNNRNQCSDVPPNPSNSATSGADGGFAMYANTPRQYYLFASKPHPQNPRGTGARPILGEGTVTVTAGDTAVADAIMEATGSITGIVRAADNTPVVGAWVDLYLIVGGSQQRARGTRTDTAGRYRLFDVPLGPVRLIAEDDASAAQGSIDANISVDTETVADISLRPFGAAHVQVNYARGATAGGAYLRTSLGNQAFADSNGRMSFQLPEGVHTITADHPDDGNPVLRGAATATISAPGEQVNVVITLGPAGSVTGTVVRPDGTTLADGFPYTVQQLSGAGNEHRSANTLNTGNYRADGLPIGHYVITAYDAAQDRYADAEFVLTEDGEEVVVDLTLLENRIALPADLRDANRFRFDVQRSGALNHGSGNFNVAAASLTVNGQAYVGETSARLEAQRRQFLIAQPAAIDGVQVSRRIHVPRGAYYARYLEIFENPGSEPRVLQVQLRNRLSAGTVLSTSSADAEVTTADRWVSFDDAVDEDILLRDNQIAPSAFVYAGVNATQPPDVVELVTVDDRPQLSQRWSALTIPAGGRVVLMHFVAQQINRAGIQAAAERLVQLPPEVLAELDPADRDAIVNFVMPAPEDQPLPAIPSLTGRLNGIAFEGDERTPVRGARITVQSTHPLFNRIWGKIPDPYCPPGTGVGSLRSLSSVPPNQPNPPLLGSFSLQGQLTANDSIALPEGVPVRMVAQEPTPCFGGASGHPWTHVPSRVEMVSPSAERNVVWDTGVLTGTVVGAADFSVTSGRLYRSIDNPDAWEYMYVPIGADGSYVYPGLLPGNYDLLFDTQHPDAAGSDVLRGQRSQVIVELGEITVTDLSLQPTGRIQGAIVTYTGEQSVGARVILSGLAADQTYDQCASDCVPQTLSKHRGKRAVNREVRTDSLGRYAFAAVPTGSYTLTVVDPISDGRKSVALTVSTDQTTVQNMTLLQLGRVDLTVHTATGTPAADAYVHLFAVAQGFEEVAGRTNGLGQLTIANIPEGDYTIRVRDPRFPNAAYMDRTTSGSILSQGQADSRTVQLRAAVSLAIHVIDSSTGGAGIAGATVSLIDGRGTSTLANTNASGDTSATAVPEGTVAVRARARINNIDREGIVNVAVNAGNDNQNIAVVVDLALALVPLPRNLYDANRSSYDIQRDGAGWRMPDLSIAGVAYTGATTASQQLDQRQYLIEQSTPIAGLLVSRKVHVPRNGYYARYLEVLENPTAEAITVDVVLRAFGGSSETVRDTSSGDSTLSNEGVDRDRWFSVGSFSGSQLDTTVHIAGSAGAALPDAQLSHQYVPQQGAYESRIAWNGVTVAAGARVVLMHFVAHQSDRLAAIASAERLAQLPPEVLDGLIDEPAAGIVTHAVPANGQSALPALPSLLGRISGRVLEGDGSTVAGARISARSQNPLYSRSWDSYDVAGLQSSAEGVYVFDGVLRDDQYSVAIPVDAAVELVADHPQSVESATALATLTPQTPETTVDVQFNSGVVHGRVTGIFQYAPIAGTVRAYVGASLRGETSFGSDGIYRIGGLAAGSYRLRANLSIQQGTDLLVDLDNVAIVAGQDREQDLVMPPNGAVSGVVRTAAGNALPNTHVRLSGAGYSREIYTDADGRYAHNAVPAGTALLAVTDPRTTAVLESEVIVVANQNLVADVSLPAAGVVTITTRYARGEIAPSVGLYLTAPSISGERWLGQSNASGVLAVSVPVGSYSVRALHPLTSESSTTTGQVDSDGQLLSLDAVLMPSARAQVLVHRSGVAQSGVRVNAQRLGSSGNTSSGTTDANGRFTTSHLRAARHALTAVTTTTTGSSEILIDAAVDGQIVPIEIDLDTALFSEGLLSFAGERHLYSVQLTTGQRLAIAINGAVVDSVAALCQARAQVYAPNNSLIADGYGAGASPYSQQNTTGDLRNVQATSDGRYIVAVSRYQSSCSVGGYRVAAMRDGQPQAFSRDVGGGTVAGRVLRPDGVTPVVGAIVRLQASGAPGSHEQRLTAADGSFQFAPIPIGGFVLGYHPSGAQPALVSHNGYLAQTGEAIVQDLVLPATTTVNIQVLGDDALPYPGTVQLSLRSGGSWLTRYTDNQGRYSHLHVGNNPLTVLAYHPQNSTVIDSVEVQALDGGVRDVSLSLASGRFSGSVLNSAAQPVPHAEVEIRSESDDYLTYTQSDAAGAYLTPPLASARPLRLLARDPQNYVTVETLAQPVTGATTPLDLVLPARGEVLVRVVNGAGAPIPEAYSHAAFETRLGSGDYSTHGWGGTDSNGEHLIEHLPVGRPLSIRAEYYLGGGYRGKGEGGGGGNYVYAETEITLDTPGAQVLVELVLDIPGGAVRAVVSTADGEPLDGQGTCYLVLDPGPENGEYAEGDCSEPLLLNSVPEGEHEATVYGSDFYESGIPVTVVDGETAEIEVFLSVVKGQVRFANGSVADDAYVDIESADGSGRSTNTDAEGRYRVFNVPLGDLVARADDNNSGLHVEASASLADAGVPLIIDLQLPASARIEGIVRDAAAQPLANARVVARNLEHDIYRTAETDANGAYQIDRMALGAFDAAAIPADSANLAQASGSLDIAETTLNLDLTLAESAAVGGSVRGADTLPVAGACVEYRSSVAGFGYQELYLSTISDAQGGYSFGSVYGGPYSILARNCSDYVNAGLADGVVASAGVAVSDVDIGNARMLGLALADSVSGFSFHANGDGSVYAWTMPNYWHSVFDYPIQLMLADEYFPYFPAARHAQSMRQMDVGPAYVEGLRVTRQTYVPAAGGYARVVDVFSNVGDQPISVPLSLRGAHNSGAVLVAPPAQQGGRYLLQRSSDTTGSYTPGVAAYVLSGVGGTAADTVDFVEGRGAFSFGWQLSLAPGETRRYLHYLVVRQPDAAAAAESQAQSLMQMTEPGMFDGLSNSERAEIINFLVPAQ